MSEIAERRLAAARSDIRQVERFIYRELSAAEGDDEVTAARNLLRLAIGLRRLLDQYHCAADRAPDGPAPATAHQEE
jgi:hypothetical protein